MYFAAFTDELLKKRWKNLRDAMMKCLKKIDLVSRSGAGTSKTPTCKHFNDLLFIRDSVSNRSTESNIVNERNVGDMACSLVHSPLTPLQTTANSPMPTIELKGDDGQPPSKKSKHERKKEGIESAERRDQIDLLLAKALTTTQSEEHDNLEDDPDLLFCKSIVSSLKNLPPRKNRRAKIEIQQVLLKHEFDE